MSIEIPITDISSLTPAVKRRRTWRGQLESPADRPQNEWWCKGHREEATYNANGDLLKTDQNCERPTVTRTAAQIAKQEFTAAGATVTGAQLLALCAVAFDTFDEEDATQE